MENKIGNRELRKIELQILKYIDDICRTNNLRYFLAGGTLLGAIRHKGFIPWDDDIDISMPRTDYDKFVNLVKMNQSLKIPYELYSYENSVGYYHTFAKLVDKRTKLLEHDQESIGVCVDIFIIDGLGNDFIKAKRISKKLTFIRSLFSLSYRNMYSTSGNMMKTLLRFPFWLLSRVLGPGYLNKKISNCATRNDFETSEWVGCVTGGRYGEREVLPSSVFKSTVDVAFEDSFFKAPAGHHEYLRSLYGSYMELPPVEQQQPKHQIKAWWLEEKRG